MPVQTEEQSELKQYAVTYILMAINIAVYIVMLICKVSPDDPDSMIRWGAMFSPLVLSGEWWRIITACFLHFNATHLMSNMIVLFALGRLNEPALGKVRYAAIYLLSGILSNIVSMVFHVATGQIVVSAGASGAIYGLLGAMTCLAFFGKSGIEGIYKKRIPLMLILVIAGSIFGEPNVDYIGHISGLLIGFAITFIIMPRKQRELEKNEDTTLC